MCFVFILVFLNFETKTHQLSSIHACRGRTAESGVNIHSELLQHCCIHCCFFSVAAALRKPFFSKTKKNPKTGFGTLSSVLSGKKNTKLQKLYRLFAVLLSHCQIVCFVNSFLFYSFEKKRSVNNNNTSSSRTTKSKGKQKKKNITPLFFLVRWLTDWLAIQPASEHSASCTMEKCQ